MITPAPLYVAAPFGAPTHAEREWNTRRAEFLGQLAQMLGHDAVVVHTDILAGRWGDDANPANRAAGLGATTEICRDVCVRKGIVWALRQRDGGISRGVRQEIDVAMREAQEAPVVLTWQEWGSVVQAIWPAGRARWRQLNTFDLDAA